MPEYREIAGHPGYRVGDDGSVWSCKRRGNKEPRFSTEWHPLKLTPHSDGYRVVGLRKGAGKCPLFFVHRLVLEAFVGPCPDGMEARHVNDRDRTDNRLSNLKWGTPVENAADKSRHGAQPRGSRVTGHKLTEQDIPEIFRLKTTGLTNEEIAQRVHVSESVVWKILHRKIWAHVAIQGTNP